MTDSSPGQTPAMMTVRQSALAIAVFILGCMAVIWLGARQSHGMITDSQDFWIVYSQRLWPLAALAVGGIAFAFACAWKRPVAAIVPGRRLHVAIWSIVAASVLLSLAAVAVVRDFPSSSDEYNYLFLAQTYLAGRLWDPLPPAYEFMSAARIIAHDGKWVTGYLPGWPALLAGLRWLGLPFWLAAPACGLVALAIFARFCQREGGLVAAFLGLLLLAPTPFFIYNAGSYFTHVPATIFGLLFCLFGIDFIDRPRVRSALLAGAALGALGTIRPYDVFIFAVPALVEVLLKIRRDQYLKAGAVVLGGLPFLIALLIYQKDITGSMFLSVWAWGGYTMDDIGFVPLSHMTDPETLGEQARMILVHLIQLGEWTSPLLVLAYPVALVMKGVRFRLRFYDFVFPATVAAYFLYADMGGNAYGPRYYFEATQLLVMTIVTWLADLLQRQPARAPWAVGLTAAHVLESVAGVAVLGVFLHLIVDGRMDIYDQTQAMGLKDAVVIVRSGVDPYNQDMKPIELTRNGIECCGPVVYVLDLPGRENELRQFFPGRQIYVYTRADGAIRGTIAPLAN